MVEDAVRAAPDTNSARARVQWIGRMEREKNPDGQPERGAAEHPLKKKGPRGCRGAQLTPRSEATEESVIS